MNLKLAIVKYKNFPCTSCGQCCNHLDIATSHIDSLASTYNIPIEELEFPYEYDASGRCEMLKDNKCLVYENRPNMCNIEWMQKRMGIEKNRFYDMNIKVCNQLMDNAGIDESFRIK